MRFISLSSGASLRDSDRLPISVSRTAWHTVIVWFTGRFQSPARRAFRFSELGVKRGHLIRIVAVELMLMLGIPRANVLHNF